MINDFMPPYQPGALSEDYNELIQCWINGPENVEGCDWIIPPGGDCESQVLSIQDNHVINSFLIQQNYPNPFNPITNIIYNIPEDGFVKITVFDILGNVINQLVNEVQNSGYKTVKWDATNNKGQPVSAGVYLYTIEAGEFRQTKKMILLK